MKDFRRYLVQTFFCFNYELVRTVCTPTTAVYRATERHRAEAHIVQRILPAAFANVHALHVHPVTWDEIAAGE